MRDDGPVDGMLTGERKADFSGIYAQPDPREYFRVLREFEYQIPVHALPVFRSVLAASRRSGRNQTILDVCCSYGVNSAYLFSTQAPDLVTDRYASPAIAALSPAELAAADRVRYGACHDGLTVLGLDASASAIGYGLRSGLLDGGWAENLETSAPSASLRSGITDVGVIISTGGVGYVGSRTFGRLLESVRSPEDLWLAIFVLRVFDYSPIASLLESYGLVTESLGRTFRQRRFSSAQEQEAAIHDVELRGLDPVGKEADGWYHAECFLTRPAAAAGLPVAELLGDAWK
jgi:hypothetical protein